jgi:multidrug efflux pump
VQIHPDDRRDPGVVERLYVRNNDTNDLIPLSSLVDVTHDVGAIQLNHYMGNRSVTINANVAEGSSLGEALNYLENTTEQQLKGVTPFYTGYSETFIESQGQFVIVFGVALIVVYLVLSGMFNSFIDPFIILLTVPLSLFGGLALLKLAGASMNLYSQIGLVTLMGLISKHGILIVDFANEQRRDGMPLREAIITAAQLRLRPILMTTGAMVLGAVPLAITTGPGSESRHPLGYVIIGGMTFGTCLTLLVIPTAYYLLARFEKPRHNDEVDPDSDAASKTDATPA